MEHSTPAALCPDCGGEYVVAGALEAPGEGCREPRFRPAGLRAVHLPPGAVELREAPAAHACLTCGLVWARVARLELRQLLIDQGDDQTRARASAVPTASRHARGGGG